MCGILGIAGRIPDRLQFRRALDLLQHRGPDGQGIWQQSETYPVTFGHRRLSILDISAAGHQPMQRGSLTITFNGEIYNFPELQQQLSKKGWTFQSGSDTEVLLAAWECLGARVLEDAERNVGFCDLGFREPSIDSLKGSLRQKTTVL